MTFEDAVWIGLGLKAGKDYDVKMPSTADIARGIQLTAPPRKRHEVDGCDFCERFKGQMHPSHDASDRCESGKHEHCTCDVCF